MSQNAEHLSWTFDEVDSKLQDIMANIYTAASEAAEKYGHPGNLIFGANIAGFLKVADAMMAQGVLEARGTTLIQRVPSIENLRALAFC